MSLVRFQSKNHPQQQTKDDVDDRATIAEVFNPLDDVYGFTVDAAAAPHNAKCERFWTIEDDGLAQDWSEEIVWCNPPYSNIRPWVAKALKSPGETVLLLPANRTEQSWWQDLIEPHRDNGGRVHTQFIGGRIPFLMSGQTSVPPNSRPPFGCVLVIVEPGIPIDLEPPALFGRDGAVA